MGSLAPILVHTLTPGLGAWSWKLGALLSEFYVLDSLLKGNVVSVLIPLMTLRYMN